MKGLKWNPTRKTILIITDEYFCKKKRFKIFRGSSSGYVAKKSVRNFVIDKYGSICVNCKSTENIQIYHIKSVHRCFNENEFYYCNSIENLQPLCGSCNASKLP